MSEPVSKTFVGRLESLIESAKQAEFYRSGNLLNFVWFQVLWFAGVMTAASDYRYAVMLMIAVLVGGYFYHIWDELNASTLIKVSLVTILGIGLESIWMSLDYIDYIHSNSAFNLPPFWLACLWLSVAISLKYSLAWLEKNLGLAALFSLCSCPLSYYAAQRLGALEITIPLATFMVTIALAWAVVIPLFLFFIHFNDNRNDNRGRHSE